MREAKKIANRNIALLSPLVNAEAPLIGIEPSAILTFRDEYIDLADDELYSTAKEMSKHVFTIDEFIAKEIAKGNINKEQFTKEKKKIMLHGHCQQKALSSVAPTVNLLSLPENYSVETIPSGCCGMAGSFGYEKDKYEVSVACGERKLLPEVRKAGLSTIIVADGFSCKEQIAQETNRDALHLVEVLEMGLRPDTNGQTVMYPERQFVGARKAALNRSMMRAGLITLSALAITVAGLFWSTSRRR